ncbi:MAG: hypothetical protein OXH22_11405 [Chloroflexi bacterium]|nr:hypothetical protein [Chloroflexota bacterium]
MSDWNLLSDFQKNMCKNARHKGINVFHTMGGIIIKDGVKGYEPDVESAEARDAIEVLESLGFIECDGWDNKGRKSYFILTHNAYQALAKHMVGQVEMDTESE